MSEFLALTSSVLNIGFRILVVFLCTVLAVWSMMRARYRFDPLVTLFFAIYSARLITDLENPMLPNIEDDALFFLATVLIPTLSMGGVRDWFDERLMLRFSLFIGGLGAALTILMLSSEFVVAELERQQQDRAILSFLNPIAIGYHGLFTATAGIILFAKYRTRWWVVPCAVAVALGTYLMVRSGSRGPFVALLASVVLTAAANRHANGAYVALAIIAAAVIAWFGLPESVLNRFLAVGVDESSLERIFAIEQSIDLALSNPLLGYAYIEPVTGLYPHNLLIESGLALGVAGFALMAWLQLSMLVKAWRLADQGEWGLPSLGAATIAGCWFSGAIWGSGLFFILLWMLRAIQINRAALHRPINETGNGH